MINWTIKWTKSAFKKLQKIQVKDQKRILSKLDEIRIQPDEFVKKLTNRNELKLRIGDFRLFIELNRGKLIILVLKIGDRKSIYKKK